MDAKLKWLLITTLTSLMISVGSCSVKDIYARVAKVEIKTNKIEVIEQKLDDFKSSFEEFKQDVKDDIKRHHR